MTTEATEVEVIEPAATEEELAATAEKQSDPAPEINDADAAEAAQQKGVQKRIDRLTREKYELKAKADLYEQLLSQRQAPTESRQAAEGRPMQSQYANAEDFVEALTDWKLAQREQVSKAQESQRAQQTMVQKRDTIFAEAEKLGDFDPDDFAANVNVTGPMADAILDSDVGAKLVLHLNAHPEEANRIAKLAPARQAAEIGKLEAKLSTVAPPPKSGAPKPISTLSGGGKQAVALSDDLSADEWAAMRNAQLRSRNK